MGARISNVSHDLLEDSHIVRTSVRHSATPRVPLCRSDHILTLDNEESIC